MRAGILLIVLYWALFTIRAGLQPKVAAGFRQKRKVSVYHVGDVTRVEVENAGRADIPAAVKALNEQATEVDE